MDDPRIQSAPTQPIARNEPLALAPGDCLGRYTVRRAIGAGGMGEVYAAHDPVLDRIVALKILRTTVGGSSAEARARFRREAQAMARLSHPNVVSIFDVGDAAERVFVAMELVDGPTMAQWLGQGRHPLGEIIDVFLQAGRGLEAAHAAGIVHRDFKPGNVILGDRVRVVDFGLARAAHDPSPDAPGKGSPDTILHASVTQTGALLGTPAYMAPEQRLGELPSPASDQYAFAVALHEALHGVRPDQRGDKRRIPRRLRALVARGLAATPQERYPSMTALLTELRRAQIRRRGGWIAAGAVAAASVGAVVLGRPLPPARWSPVTMGSHPIEGGIVDYEVSRDGSTLGFGFARGDEVDVEARTGGARRRVAPSPGAGRIIEFLPSFDGKAVILATGVPNEETIYWSVDVATGAVRRLYPPSGEAVASAYDDFAVGPEDDLLVVPLTPEGAHAGLTHVDRAGNVRQVFSLSPGDQIHTVRMSFDGKRAVYRLFQSTGAVTEIVELATGARRRVGSGACFRVDWSSPDSLLCARPQEGGFVVEELAVDGARQLRYQSPPYDMLVDFHTTTKGAFFITRTMRAHLATLALSAPSRLELVSSGSNTDLFPAGFTSSGDVVFGVEIGDRLRMMRAHAGRADFLVPGPDDGVPLAVLGDDIVFGRFDDPGRALGRLNEIGGRIFPATGELVLRRADGSTSSLGTTTRFHDLRCAGDRSPPCLLMEGPADDIQAVLLDPQTGARSAPLFRFSLFKEAFHALSWDGKTVARTVFNAHPGIGDIELSQLDGSARRRIRSPSFVSRHLVFEEGGSLLVTGWDDDASGSVLVRLTEDAAPTTLASQHRYLFEPRLDRDGTHVAFTTSDLESTTWWVDR